MGRKPVGDKAMTDAERQRRRRQRLRAAQENSVTSRNDGVSDDKIRKRIEWLERENKRLRKDAKEWRDYGLGCQEDTAREHQKNVEETSRLREENYQLEERLREQDREIRKVK